jgi:cytidine deaminase
MVTEAWRARLLKAAAEARERAYAPYSGLRVGAALLTRRGNIFSGCNVENASYGLTVCAERAAVFAAVAQEGPELRIQALAVVGEPGAQFPPCGACRQVLAEFGPEAVVLFQGEGGLTEARLEDLLPHGFRMPEGR